MSFEYYNDVNLFYTLRDENISYIVSIYNEKFEQLSAFNKLYLYDKNPIKSENFYKYIKPDVNYEHLDNVGRCDHTYLYHIIKHYDNLSDINIFIPASVSYEYS